MDSDRKAKLEALRKKKEERDKPKPDKPTVSLGQGDDLLDKILSETLKNQNVATQPEETKAHTDASPEKTKIETKEPSPQKKPRKPLKFDYYMDQFNLPGKLKPEPIDQIIQVDMGDESDQQRVRPSVGGSAFKEEDEAVHELPSKPKQQIPGRRISKVMEPLQPMQINRLVGDKKEFTSEELKNIMKSKDFTDFFHKTSKLIEKAIDTKEVDGLEALLEKETGDNFDASKSKERLEQLISFYDVQHSANRIVTSLEWSPNLPDLVLASYSQNLEGNPNDPQGVALIWSMALKSRPEFSLFCQSTITASKFNPYSNSLIVGGTYSGQIVLWDLRAKTTPVQRSAMTSNGHAHPVYSLSIVGSQNAHNIVSVSNDGRLCLWNLSMLSTPQKTVDLKFKSAVQQSTQPLTQQQQGPSALNPTCITFHDEDANNFFVGVEDGNFYSAQIHASQSKGENVLDVFEGHQAPISSLSILPNRQDIPSDVSGLILSSSFDWTVKLWSPKFKNKPLITFESSDDYIYDVCWNRANPSLFSAVDGEGYIHLWDISKDIEAPIFKYKADSHAINKARWNEDGTKLMTGNTTGYVKIYGAHKSLLKTSVDSIEKFGTTIIDLLKTEEEAI